MDWSHDDQNAAFAMGWGLFTVDDGSTRIQRLDDPRSTGLPDMPEDPVFVSDAEAQRFVDNRANEGCDLCERALAASDR